MNETLKLKGIPTPNVSDKYMKWDTLNTCEVDFAMWQGALDDLKPAPYTKTPLKELLRHLYSLETVRLVNLRVIRYSPAMVYLEQDEPKICGRKLF